MIRNHDVVCIQEPGAGVPMLMERHLAVRFAAQQQAAILWKEHLQASPCPPPLPDVPNLAVTIETLRGPLTVGSAYIPHPHLTMRQTLQALTHIETPYLLAGDWNISDHLVASFTDGLGAPPSNPQQSSNYASRIQRTLPFVQRHGR